MITEAQLTLTGYPGERKPVPGFTSFVNSVLALTETEFQDWSFYGMENTRVVGDGYFSGLYKRGGGFSFKFCMATGLFRIDCKQVFWTDLEGMLSWFKESYWESEKPVSECGIDRERGQKLPPRRQDRLTRKAGLVITKMEEMAAR